MADGYVLYARIGIGRQVFPEQGRDILIHPLQNTFVDGDADKRRDDRFGRRLDICRCGNGMTAIAALGEDLAVLRYDHGFKRPKVGRMVENLGKGRGMDPGARL